MKISKAFPCSSNTAKQPASNRLRILSIDIHITESDSMYRASKKICKARGNPQLKGRADSAANNRKKLEIEFCYSKTVAKNGDAKKPHNLTTFSILG